MITPIETLILTILPTGIALFICLAFRRPWPFVLLPLAFSLTLITLDAVQIYLNEFGIVVGMYATCLIASIAYGSFALLVRWQRTRRSQLTILKGMLHCGIGGFFAGLFLTSPLVIYGYATQDSWLVLTFSIDVTVLAMSLVFAVLGFFSGVIVGFAMDFYIGIKSNAEHRSKQQNAAQHNTDEPDNGDHSSIGTAKHTQELQTTREH